MKEQMRVSSLVQTTAKFDGQNYEPAVQVNLHNKTTFNTANFAVRPGQEPLIGAQFEVTISAVESLADISARI